MAALPPPRRSRRPRPGSLERPVNAKLYRGTWLLVGLPLLLAAFSVARPTPLPAPEQLSALDGRALATLTRDLVQTSSNRYPGSLGAHNAAQWFGDQLRPYGLQIRSEPFSAVVPGVGTNRGRALSSVLTASLVGLCPILADWGSFCQPAKNRYRVSPLKKRV